MKNPYKIDTPAKISFSGGRTSGYMLYHIIQAFGGKLPSDVKVVFCNTGKERPETLRFVERCSLEWNVDVVWLEYTSTLKDRPLGKARNGRDESPYEHGFKVVNYATASRNGEPFEAAIRSRGMLPNVVSRFCTVECKIRTAQRYLDSIGFGYYTNAIGFRYDEPKRVAKLKTTNSHKDEDPVAPMFDAKVVKKDVIDWWSKQPFDLELKDYEGNCDLCFLKSQSKIQAIIRDNPELAEWWIKAEREAALNNRVADKSVSVFRKDRPRYEMQLEISRHKGILDLLEDDELSIACHCTD